jgi:hypothetical protein
LKRVHSYETTVSTVGSRYRTSTLSHTTSVPIAAARVTCVLVSKELFERDYREHVTVLYFQCGVASQVQSRTRTSLVTTCPTSNFVSESTIPMERRNIRGIYLHVPLPLRHLSKTQSSSGWMIREVSHQNLGTCTRGLPSLCNAARRREPPYCFTPHPPNFLHLNFRRQSHLLNTIMAESAARDRSLSCQFCDKSFGRSEHLKRHILTHTRTREHQCRLCDKAFFRK